VAEQLDGEELVAPPPLPRAWVASPFVLPSAARGIAAPQGEDLRPLVPLEDHPGPPDRPLDRPGESWGPEPPWQTLTLPACRANSVNWGAPPPSRSLAEAAESEPETTLDGMARC